MVKKFGKIILYIFVYSCGYRNYCWSDWYQFIIVSNINWSLDENS